MIKLIFITDSMSSGGAERVISVLANHFAEKWPVEIICLSGNGSFYPLHDKVRLTCLEPLYGKNLVRKFIWLHTNVKSDSLVIAFMVNVYLFTLAALFFKSVKIIVSERNDPTAHKFPIRLLRKILIWRAQRIVVQTEDIAAYFPRFLRNKIDIIYNPISDKYIWKSGLSAVKEKKIVTIGRLSPQKNHKMMIDAFAKVVKQFPDYQLHIYGEGEIRNETEAFIKSKGLENKVFLRGRCNNLSAVLPHAEIFVMSSDYEGMSNALIEAMYVGIPVVTTAVSGTKELIKDGVNGFVVPIKDEKAFAEAILKLLNDKDKRELFSAEEVNIISKVKPSIIFKNWEKVIEKVWRK